METLIFEHFWIVLELFFGDFLFQSGIVCNAICLRCSLKAHKVSFFEILGKPLRPQILGGLKLADASSDTDERRA